MYYSQILYAVNWSGLGRKGLRVAKLHYLHSGPPIASQNVTAVWYPVSHRDVERCMVAGSYGPFEITIVVR